jgi:putative ABC transport system permease protein
VLLLALRNLLRRPLRNGLTIGGLAAAIALFASLLAFERGYKRALGSELDRMGLQLMLVPLGCPYDAAARVLKGRGLENSLPEAALAEVRRDSAVAVAAPLLICACSRQREHRVDMWVGLDRSALELKPWWRAGAGESWFADDDSVVLGCDAAEIEMRSPGDLFFEPETKHEFRVAGVLERSGTSDDSLFFVPLQTAQRMFDRQGRLTAIAIRLRDPGLLREASERLQRIPGTQVVTVTEMMGVFLNLVGAARTLMQALALIALAVSVLSVLNTLLAGVVERTGEISVLRAIGASRIQVLSLISVEGLLLTVVGSAAGIILALMAGHGVEELARRFVPFVPNEPLMVLNGSILWRSLGLAVVVGILGGLYPAWRASRLSPVAALKAS